MRACNRCPALRMHERCAKVMLSCQSSSTAKSFSFPDVFDDKFVKEYLHGMISVWLLPIHVEIGVLLTSDSGYDTYECRSKGPCLECSMR